MAELIEELKRLNQDNDTAKEIIEIIEEGKDNVN
jgi:hypothetical protein